MVRMTPDEFFLKWIGHTSTNPGDSISLCRDEHGLYDLMTKYHDHCEESAWVSVEDVEFPPVEKTSDFGIHSENVIVKTPYTICEGYADMESGVWFSANGYKITVTHWRPLPQPPK